MKEKFRLSALFAGGLIMLAPVVRLLGRICRMIIDGEIYNEFVYYLFIGAVVGVGLTLAVSAFTKWAKIPAVVCSAGAILILFHWTIEEFEWFLEEFTYGGMSTYTWIYLCYVLLDIVEIMGFVALGALLITSLAKPQLKALKILSFIPFLLMLPSFAIYAVALLIEAFDFGLSDYLGWAISEGFFMSDIGILSYCIIITIGLLLFGISLRPKKVKEIEEM